MSLTYLARAPSNIAFLKYWGKQDAKEQWPANDSLSMTLSTCYSETRAQLGADGHEHRISFAGKTVARTEESWSKVYRFVDFLQEQGGFTEPLTIATQNSFPTSCGIASSASGYAALTLATLAAWTGATNLVELADLGYPLGTLSTLSRLGSGSACRSWHDGYVHWHKGEDASSQKVEAVCSSAHWRLYDVLVILNRDAKGLSSSAAHQRAWSSPFFLPRLAELPRKLEKMKHALISRSLKDLGPLLEQEALEMHTVAMTSDPPHCYWSKETPEFLAAIKQARQRGVFDAYFTIDAGPNIHLILTEEHLPRLQQWLEDFYPQWERRIDHVGEGPTLTVES